ncbi:hypothetical protein KXX06_001259, partial [Aspergillus fumigatus]
VLAIRYLKQSYGLAYQFDEEPFQRVLTYATRTWNLADEYLRRAADVNRLQ